MCLVKERHLFVVCEKKRIHASVSINFSSIIPYFSFLCYNDKNRNEGRNASETSDKRMARQLYRKTQRRRQLCGKTQRS